MVYLTNSYVWGAVLAWLIFFGAAAYYISRAATLSKFVNERCPELWQKLLWNWQRPGSKYYYGQRANQIECLVLFNWAAKDHPNDPEFKRLLRGTRWSAAISLVAFVTGLALVGKADVSIHYSSLRTLATIESH